MSSPRKAFDPLKLARATESVVCRGNQRKYSRYGWTRDYGTRVPTGYVVGCTLRCAFCWSEPSRDLPEKIGVFQSPEQVLKGLLSVSRKTGSRIARVSGGEPTLCRRHILGLLDLVESSKFERFVLETNGLLLGSDVSYVRELARFKKILVRVSLKAGTPRDFTRKTGSKPEFFELPFRAIRELIANGIRFNVAAMSRDTALMNPVERVGLIQRLAEIDPRLPLRLEEEVFYPYPQSVQRMRAAGMDPGGVVRYVYQPVTSLRRKSFLLSLQYTLKAILERFRGI